MEALEERLHSENNSKLQKLREEFQEAQAEQVGEFNRKQAVAADDAIRLTRQLEDELADNTVAFEHFQGDFFTLLGRVISDFNIKLNLTLTMLS